MNSLFEVAGRIKLLHYRQGNLIREINNHNCILWQGKADILNEFFGNTANWSNFYVGLLNNPCTYLTEPSATPANLFSTEFVAYSEATRPALTFVAAVSPGTDGSNIYTASSDSPYATFTITGPGSLSGLYVASADVKASAPARVWCSAAFGNDDSAPEELPVVASDILRVQYTIMIPKA